MIKLTRKEEKAFTSYLFQQDFISEGSGRKVYAWRDWVIKVAKNRNGYYQNKYEVERFIKYGKENLAEIIAYSKKIVIMERVKTNLTKILRYNEKRAMELAEWLDHICEIESTDHIDSQGTRKNGQIVAYDYGDSKQTYSKKLITHLNYREWLATNYNKGEIKQ